MVRVVTCLLLLCCQLLLPSSDLTHTHRRRDPGMSSALFESILEVLNEPLSEFLYALTDSKVACSQTLLNPGVWPGSDTHTDQRPGVVGGWPPLSSSAPHPPSRFISCVTCVPSCLLPV